MKSYVDGMDKHMPVCCNGNTFYSPGASVEAMRNFNNHQLQWCVTLPLCVCGHNPWLLMDVGEIIEHIILELTTSLTPWSIEEVMVHERLTSETKFR